MTAEAGATYRAGVTLPATLTVTDEDYASGDHLVWGKGPDGGAVVSRHYTAEQRAEALELYVELGAPETARRLAIPKATVANWARRASLQTGAAGAPRARARTEAARARWAEVTQEHREELAGRLLAEVHTLLDQVQEATTYHHVVVVGGGKDAPASAQLVDVLVTHPIAKDQRERMQAVGIAVDRLQLLTGQATERYEDTGGLDLEAEAVQARAEKVELRHLRAVVNGDS